MWWAGYISYVKEAWGTMVSRARTESIHGNHVAAIEEWATGLVYVLVAVLLGLVMLPIIQTQIWAANTSLNASQRALLSIIVLMVPIALVLLVVRWAMQKHGSD